MARSYNRIELIGHLTHNPEFRKASSGTPICAFGLATNRNWTAESGERKEETAFHRIVAWKTLAEQCARLLRRGRRVFVAGRLSYRTYTQEDGTAYPIAEVVIDEMLLLDDKRPGEPDPPATRESAKAVETTRDAEPTSSMSTTLASTSFSSSDESADEIPF